MAGSASLGIDPGTARSSAAAGRSTRPETRWGLGLLLVLGAFALGQLVLYVAARTSATDPFALGSYARFDSGLYARIADDGYLLARCEGVRNRSPEDWCGTAGWLPLLPGVLRLGSTLGLSYLTTGVLLAHAMTLAVLGLVWWGFLRDARPAVAGAVLGLVAVFPGGPWSRAMSPLSIGIAATLGMVLAVGRRRLLLGGIAGAVAVLAHSLGVVAVAACALVAAYQDRRSFAAAVRTLALVGAPGALAYGGWLLLLERSTGRWDAYFLVQASYGHESGFPPIVLVQRMRYLLDGGSAGGYARWTSVQELLLAVLVVAALAVAVRARDRLAREDVLALAVGSATWLANLQAGLTISFWRLQLMALPLVVVLRHAPPAVVGALAVALLPVEVQIARGFFDSVLS